MSIHFGFTSPRDILAKAGRDLDRLRRALNTIEDEEVGDALFDFAVAISSVRDWLRAHPSTSFTVDDVDAAARTQSLEVFRDISNGTKHRSLRYTPGTMEVLVSAQPGVGTFLLPASGDVKLYTTGPKLKAVTTDSVRHEILELAHDAIYTWESFLDCHNV